MNLPPDPEGMNDVRAEWADQAMRRFAEQTNQDMEFEADDILGDLLCDLMHWCDRNGVRFESYLNRAESHYEEETQEEE